MQNNLVKMNLLTKMARLTNILLSFPKMEKPSLAQIIVAIIIQAMYLSEYFFFFYGV